MKLTSQPSQSALPTLPLETSTHVINA